MADVDPPIPAPAPPADEPVLPLFAGWAAMAAQGVFQPRRLLTRTIQRISLPSGVLLIFTHWAVVWTAIMVVGVYCNDPFAREFSKALRSPWFQQILTFGQPYVTGAAFLASAGILAGSAAAGCRGLKAAMRAGVACAAFASVWLPVIAIPAVTAFGMSDHVMRRYGGNADDFSVWGSAFASTLVYGVMLLIAVCVSATAYERGDASRQRSAPPEATCEWCGYLLVNIADDHMCPECGKPVSASTTHNARRPLPVDTAFTADNWWHAFRAGLAFPLKTVDEIEVRSHWASTRRLWICHSVLAAVLVLLPLAISPLVHVLFGLSNGRAWRDIAMDLPSQRWVILQFSFALLAMVLSLGFPAMLAHRASGRERTFGPGWLGPGFRVAVLVMPQLLFALFALAMLRIGADLLCDVIEMRLFEWSQWGKIYVDIGIGMLLPGLIAYLVCAVLAIQRVRFANR